MQVVLLLAVEGQFGVLWLALVVVLLLRLQC